MTKTTLQEDVRACVQALTAIHESVMDAAALIAKCAKRHPGFIDSLAREVPGVSLAFLRRLQRVGEGSLDPRVALGIEHGLFIEKLNIEDQKKDY
jgi:hypothetical protein